MDMASGTYLAFLAGEVKAGRISMKQIDDSVRTILETKVRMGLFENPYVDLDRMSGSAERPEAQQEAARKPCSVSVVLLRNENSLLPLDKTGERVKSVAVIGPLGRCRNRPARHVGRSGEARPDGQHPARHQETRSAARCRSNSRTGRTSAASIPSMFDGIPDQHHEGAAEANSRRSAQSRSTTR